MSSAEDMSYSNDNNKHEWVWSHSRETGCKTVRSTSETHTTYAWRAPFTFSLTHGTKEGDKREQSPGPWSPGLKFQKGNIAGETALF